LAEYINKSIQAYNRYELGSRKVPYEVLSRIASYYNYPVHAFFIRESNSDDYSDLTIADLGALFVMKRSDYMKHHKRLELIRTSKINVPEENVDALLQIKSELVAIDSAINSKISETFRAASLLEIQKK
jgi:transcriptional regulator with XRE-family HTH domain